MSEKTTPFPTEKPSVKEKLEGLQKQLDERVNQVASADPVVNKLQGYMQALQEMEDELPTKSG